MFAKLLKYEFKSQRGLFTILSLAALGAGLLGGLMMWLMVHNIENTTDEAASTMGAAFSGLMLMGVMLALAAYGIAVWILLLYRFYKHHFTSEGYLTFTLPATTHQILLSSILNILIWVLISGIVILVAGGMTFAPMIHKAMTELDAVLPMVEQGIEESLALYGYDNILLPIFTAISSGAYALILPLLCIVIGSLVAKKHKLLASFGIYYGISMAISILTGMLNVVVTFADMSVGGDGLYTFSVLMPAIVELCIAIGGYCIMHQLVEKKLNLP